MESEGNVEVPVQANDPATAVAPQPSNQSQPMAEGQCARCKATLYLKLPAMRVMNTPEVSLLVLSHERPQVCQKCGMGYVPIIAGVVEGRLDIQFSPCETRQAPVIVPASSQQVEVVDKSRARARGLVMS